MITLLNDFRRAARALGHAPGFALVVVLTLALGIGANTAVFTVLRGVLLKPLGYRGESELMQVTGARPGENIHDDVLSIPEYEILRDSSRTLSEVDASMEEAYNLTGGAVPERVRTTCATPNLLATLGVAPVLGRAFTAEEATVGAAPVLLLSHSVWRRQFASDPAVLGRIVLLNDRPHTVIGVLPAWFETAWGERYFGPMGIWMPFPEELRREAGNCWCLRVIGRLRPGYTLANLRAELPSLVSRIQGAHPAHDEGWTLEAHPLLDTLVGSNHRTAVLALMGAVAFVLLIGCVNVASLLLARGSACASELAVRAALGASRTRLLRHVLTECALLTLVGGAVGILLAVWAVGGLTALLPANFPRRGEIGIDATALLFAVGLSGLTCVLCGLGPAWRCSGVSLGAALQGVPRTLSTGRSGGQRRDLLVVAQVTLAVALLAGAGLMIRTFVGLAAVDPGFDPEQVLTLRAELSYNSLADWDHFADFYQRAVEEIRRVPGVTAAAGVSHIPMSDGTYSTDIDIEDYVPPDPEESPPASLIAVTPGYFGALHIPLRAGRDITRDDTAAGPPVALVNDCFVRRYWFGQDPLGRHITIGEESLAVVGVVGDVRHWGLDQDADPQVFYPVQQRPWPAVRFVVRTVGDPTAVSGLVQQAIWAVNPNQPLCSVRPLAEIVRADIGVRATLAGVLAALSGASLLLTGVGIAGVIAYTVARRTREIGVRIALGASAHDVLRLIGRRYTALIGIGLAAGLGVALLVGRLLQALLFGVSPHNPQTLLTAVVVVAGTTVLAGYLPAWRATRVDPMVALRCE
ncbi:MAG TPA: ABC transporter permease [Phycisphaerae bacterium]|nr:ABC transporter permease [Phycisphaerae bacterium]HNU44260.1 ABC transporter permease [Phycisphaerae bacterium]